MEDAAQQLNNDDSSGTQIGGVVFTIDPNRYKVVGLLGCGSFGVVAAGLERKTGGKVAIKRICPIADRASDARHILREVSIMRLLRHHPNVIGLKDVRMDSSTKTLYIVMELMECDLQQVLASDQVMTTQHVKVLLKQLLLGVQAMHVRGVIHRDLKPENVLLLSDCQLRITDFGLSRQVQRLPTEEQKAKQMNSVHLTEYVVTRWYRAPEVMLGPEGGYAEPVDMWSIGCIFGEMLGCRGPLFPGNSYSDQVTLALASLGVPDIASNDCLGYPLCDDAIQFLKAVKVLEGPALEDLVPSEVETGALDLLRKTLDLNVNLRLSAKRALEHEFLSDCQELPTQDSVLDFPGVEETVDFSFEDESLGLEELRERIAAEAAHYNEEPASHNDEPFTRTSSTPRRENSAPCGSETPPCETSTLSPSVSLEEMLGAVRTEARLDQGVCGNRELPKANGLGIGSDFTSGQGNSPSRTVALLEQGLTEVMDKRFSSMANWAGAENEVVDGLHSEQESVDCNDQGERHVGAEVETMKSTSVLPVRGDDSGKVVTAGEGTKDPCILKQEDDSSSRGVDSDRGVADVIDEGGTTREALSVGDAELGGEGAIIDAKQIQRRSLNCEGGDEINEHRGICMYPGGVRGIPGEGVREENERQERGEIGAVCNESRDGDNDLLICGDDSRWKEDMGREMMGENVSTGSQQEGKANENRVGGQKNRLRREECLNSSGELPAHEPALASSKDGGVLTTCTTELSSQGGELPEDRSEQQHEPRDSSREDEHGPASSDDSTCTAGSARPQLPGRLDEVDHQISRPNVDNPQWVDAPDREFHVQSSVHSRVSPPLEPKREDAATPGAEETRGLSEVSGDASAREPAPISGEDKQAITVTSAELSVPRSEPVEDRSEKQHGPWDSCARHTESTVCSSNSSTCTAASAASQLHERLDELASEMPEPEIDSSLSVDATGQDDHGKYTASLGVSPPVESERREYTTRLSVDETRSRLELSGDAPTYEPATVAREDGTAVTATSSELSWRGSEVTEGRNRQQHEPRDSNAAQEYDADSVVSSSDDSSCSVASAGSRLPVQSNEMAPQISEPDVDSPLCADVQGQSTGSPGASAPLEPEGQEDDVELDVESRDGAGCSGDPSVHKSVSNSREDGAAITVSSTELSLRRGEPIGDGGKQQHEPRDSSAAHGCGVTSNDGSNFAVAWTGPQPRGRSDEVDNPVSEPDVDSPLRVDAAGQAFHGHSTVSSCTSPPAGRKCGGDTGALVVTEDRDHSEVSGDAPAYEPATVAREDGVSVTASSSELSWRGSEATEDRNRQQHEPRDSSVSQEYDAESVISSSDDSSCSVASAGSQLPVQSNEMAPQISEPDVGSPQCVDAAVQDVQGQSTGSPDVSRPVEPKHRGDTTGLDLEETRDGAGCSFDSYVHESAPVSGKDGAAITVSSTELSSRRGEPVEDRSEQQHVPRDVSAAHGCEIARSSDDSTCTLAPAGSQTPGRLSGVSSRISGPDEDSPLRVDTEGQDVQRQNVLPSYASPPVQMKCRGDTTELGMKEAWDRAGFSGYPPACKPTTVSGEDDATIAVSSTELPSRRDQPSGNRSRPEHAPRDPTPGHGCEPESVVYSSGDSTRTPALAGSLLPGRLGEFDPRISEPDVDNPLCVDVAGQDIQRQPAMSSGVSPSMKPEHPRDTTTLDVTKEQGHSEVSGDPPAHEPAPISGKDGVTITLSTSELSPRRGEPTENRNEHQHEPRDSSAAHWCDTKGIVFFSGDSTRTAAPAGSQLPGRLHEVGSKVPESDGDCPLCVDAAVQNVQGWSAMSRIVSPSVKAEHRGDFTGLDVEETRDRADFSGDPPTHEAVPASCKYGAAITVSSTELSSQGGEPAENRGRHQHNPGDSSVAHGCGSESVVCSGDDSICTGAWAGCQLPGRLDKMDPQVSEPDVNSALCLDAVGQDIQGQSEVFPSVSPSVEPKRRGDTTGVDVEETPDRAVLRLPYSGSPPAHEPAPVSGEDGAEITSSSTELSSQRGEPADNRSTQQHAPRDLSAGHGCKPESVVCSGGDPTCTAASASARSQVPRRFSEMHPQVSKPNIDSPPCVDSAIQDVQGQSTVCVGVSPPEGPEYRGDPPKFCIEKEAPSKLFEGSAIENIDTRSSTKSDSEQIPSFTIDFETKLGEDSTVKITVQDEIEAVGIEIEFVGCGRINRSHGNAKNLSTNVKFRKADKLLTHTCSSDDVIVDMSPSGCGLGGRDEGHVAAGKETGNHDDVNRGVNQSARNSSAENRCSPQFPGVRKGDGTVSESQLQPHQGEIEAIVGNKLVAISGQQDHHNEFDILVKENEQSKPYNRSLDRENKATRDRQTSPGADFAVVADVALDRASSTGGKHDAGSPSDGQTESVLRVGGDSGELAPIELAYIVENPENSSKRGYYGLDNLKIVEADGSNVDCLCKSGDLLEPLSAKTNKTVESEGFASAQATGSDKLQYKACLDGVEFGCEVPVSVRGDVEIEAKGEVDSLTRDLTATQIQKPCCRCMSHRPVKESEAAMRQRRVDASPFHPFSAGCESQELDSGKTSSEDIVSRTHASCKHEKTWDNSDDEGQNKRRAATKIQAQARRRASARRTANFSRQMITNRVSSRRDQVMNTNKGGSPATSVNAGAAKPRPSRHHKVPELPIVAGSTVVASSPSPGVVAGMGRVPTAAPLAILRRLRDPPEPNPKSSITQFQLRVTIRSAIQAHKRKTGAMRKKARPLPSLPCWGPNQIFRGNTTTRQSRSIRGPLVKPRKVSPLHTCVSQVNASMAVTKVRRAQSAGASRAHERLYCALFAAETSVNHEYYRKEKYEQQQREEEERAEAANTAEIDNRIEDSTNCVEDVPMEIPPQ